MIGSLAYAGFLVSVWFLIAYIKIPVLCSGCSNHTTFFNTFFRCINETGPESKACAFEKNFKRTINRLSKDVSAATTDVHKMLVNLGTDLKDVPQDVKDAILELIQVVIDLKDRLVMALGNIKETLHSAISAAYLNIKGVLINSAKDVYKKIVTPIVENVMLHLISPIQDIFEKIIGLRNKVIESISSVLNTIGDTLMFIPDQIFGAIDTVVHVIPDAFEAILNAITGLINDAIRGTTSVLDTALVNPMNTAIKEVTGVVDSVITPIVSAYTELRNTTLRTPRIPLGIVTIPSTKIISLSSILKPELAAPNLSVGNVIPSLKIDRAIGDIGIGAISSLRDFSVKGSITSVFTNVSNLAKAAYSTVTDSFSELIERIYSIYQVFINSLTTMFVSLVDVGKILAREVQQAANQSVSIAKDALLAAFSPIINSINGVYKDLRKYMANLRDLIVQTALDIASHIGKFFIAFIAVVKKIGKFVIKNAGNFALYQLGQTADAIIPLPIKKTNKITLLVFFALFVYVYNPIFALWSDVGMPTFEEISEIVMPYLDTIRDRMSL